MRIAISGTHFSGKSTLIELLSDALPQYAVVDEPYYLLEQEGHTFAEMPSLEDFELQLERSLECLEVDKQNVIFDRCPVDLVAYLLTHEDSAAFDLDAWLLRIQAAMETLDAIVFVPVEDPDVIALPRSEDADLRLEVDAQLRELLEGSVLGCEVEVLEVTGAPQQRVRRVLTHLRNRSES